MLSKPVREVVEVPVRVVIEYDDDPGARRRALRAARKAVGLGLICSGSYTVKCTGTGKPRPVARNTQTGRRDP